MNDLIPDGDKILARSIFTEELLILLYEHDYLSSANLLYDSILKASVNPNFIKLLTTKTEQPERINEMNDILKIFEQILESSAEEPERDAIYLKAQEALAVLRIMLLTYIFDYSEEFTALNSKSEILFKQAGGRL